MNAHSPSNTQSQGTRHSESRSLFNVPYDVYQNVNYDAMSPSDLIRALKAMNRQIVRMQETRLERDNEVRALQQIVDVYETERNEKVSEMQMFQSRLAVMEDMAAELSRRKSASASLLQEQDSLWRNLQESEEKQKEEHRNYEAAVHEATKYKKLV